MAIESSYRARVDAEIEIFRNQENIHDLPSIFHYYSQKHLAALLHDVFGLTRLWDIFAAELRASIERTRNPLIVSIGAGSGDIEMAVANRLIADGFTGFRFLCLELNPVLIERGREVAAVAGLSGHVDFIETDLSQWRPDAPFGATFAHHSLHHIMALEHVFDQVFAGLAKSGSFVIFDMIGRNGHMRWPESLALIDAIWADIPNHYKYNHSLNRHEAAYENWDCSRESFEGIRAQDILPLLLERFHFTRFCAWGGLMDLFVERSFGPNLNPQNLEDTQFVDMMWDAQRALNTLGALKPTQMIATLRKEPGDLISNWGLIPARCVRDPKANPPLPKPPGPFAICLGLPMRTVRFALRRGRFYGGIIKRRLLGRSPQRS